MPADVTLQDQGATARRAVGAYFPLGDKRGSMLVSAIILSLLVLPPLLFQIRDSVTVTSAAGAMFYMMSRVAQVLRHRDLADCAMKSFGLPVGGACPALRRRRACCGAWRTTCVPITFYCIVRRSGVGMDRGG